MDVSRPTGRPREFNLDLALDRAMDVFWRKGYDGATLLDLTTAMRINRPSLYAAFGDKQALFRKALDRYAARPAAYLREALAEPTVRTVVERLFRETIRTLTDPRNPRGCLLVHGTLTCGDASESTRRTLIAHRSAGEVAIRARFERAQTEGDLSPDEDPADLARYVVTILQGMAVQAVGGGAGRNELRRVAELALRAWPK
jgi:AcrR family transcriptional regulator